MVLAGANGRVCERECVVSSDQAYRAQSSQFLTFAALPAPIPEVFVGVLTEMKMMSASLMV